MNKVIFIGNLTKDPEISETTNGVKDCKFTLAVKRKFADESDFINIVVWDKQAENVGKYVTKGRLVAIEGRIQVRNYDNNEGRKVYVTEVVANNVQFLESKNSVVGSNGNGFNSMPEPPMERTPYDFGSTSPSQTSTPASNTMDLPENDPFAAFGEQEEISDNDLPF
jgi:single-strand DNA-binding protein